MSLIRSRIRLLGALLALILLAAACGSDADVASVEGGDTLTQDDVDDLLDEGDDVADADDTGLSDDTVSTDGDAATVGDESLSGADVAELADQPGEGVIERAAAAEVITTWARNEIWYAAVAEGGFTDIQPYLDTARAEFDEFVAANPDAGLPPADSAAAFELIRAQALAPLVTDYMIEVEGHEIEWPLQLCSSHILLETEEEALAVIDRLEAGEAFADLAAELSLDGSGAGGGDLGCVDPAGFVQEFVDGAAALGGPGVTPPVQSEFGWHVIEVRSFDATPSDDPIAIQNAVLGSDDFLEFQSTVIEREVTVDPRYGVWDSVSASVVPGS
ncbi:MAG: peptidylprolyl isomerase [Acidimicrobiales bacterium]